jgi:hypothetical protein
MPLPDNQQKKYPTLPPRGGVQPGLAVDKETPEPSVLCPIWAFNIKLKAAVTVSRRVRMPASKVQRDVHCGPAVGPGRTIALARKDNVAARKD